MIKDKRIWVLALAGFATGTEAFVYAGHLNALARDTKVSLAVAGQLAAAFALTCAIAGPVVAGWAGRFDRRATIAVGLGLIGALNLLAAWQSSFAALIVIRILCGIAAGLVGPISSVAVAEIAPPEQRGRAMALTLGGVTLAFVLGVPMGSVIGDWFGWRGTFVFAGLVALSMAALTMVALPKLPARSNPTPIVFGDIASAPILLNLAMTLIGFTAAFTIVAYIGPLATAIAGLTGSGIGAVQALIGIGSILGIVIGGRSADGPYARRVLIISFAIAALSALSYTILLSSQVTAEALGPAEAVPFLTIAVMIIGMVIGASALFTRIPIIQTRLAGAARPQARPVVFALNGSMVFFGQGLGAVIGGGAIHAGGLAAIGIAAAGTGFIGLVIASFGLQMQTKEAAAK
jgi:MFS transporter, DHA1 family, inner membrane transport protein